MPNANKKSACFQAQTFPCARICPHRVLLLTNFDQFFFYFPVFSALNSILDGLGGNSQVAFLTSNVEINHLWLFLKRMFQGSRKMLKSNSVQNEYSIQVVFFARIRRLKTDSFWTVAFVLAEQRLHEKPGHDEGLKS